MLPDVVISAHGLSKSYRLFGHPGDRVKQFLSFGLRRYHREFTALQDASFDIRKGETVGIIGRNGSGKSTLLQLVCGILKPTSGTLSVKGRIAALLELGAGFNPEFTGRENVYFQGALAGLAREDMDRRLEDIAAFADIGEFIDQPVRTYSSGMFVRLAFSAAIHTDPDILVIDEVLAVGDASFQQKCFDRIYKLQSQGITILVVSHNPYQIERLCHRAAALNRGVISELLPAKEVLSLYHEMLQADMTPPAVGAAAFREGTQELRFEDIWIETEDGIQAGTVETGRPLRIVADVLAERPLDNVRFRFEVFSSSNELVTLIASNGLTEERVFHGRHRVAFAIPACQLTSGWYYFDAIAGHKNVRLDTCLRAVDFKVLLKDSRARNLSTDRGQFVSQGSWEFGPTAHAGRGYPLR